MATITLWGAHTPRSLRPLWMAEELALDYQHRPIAPRSGETQTPEYTHLNPKQKIPLLVDADITLTESVAICRYLRDRYPAPEVYRPSTDQTRAKEDEWCCYILGEIDETSLYVMRRHGDLGELYGASDTVVSSCRDYAGRHLAIVADAMGDDFFVTGDAFGIADLLLVSCLDWALAYEVPVPGTLLSYRERIAQRPAYQRAMAINYPSLSGDQ